MSTPALLSFYTQKNLCETSTTVRKIDRWGLTEEKNSWVHSRRKPPWFTCKISCLGTYDSRIRIISLEQCAFFILCGGEGWVGGGNPQIFSLSKHTSRARSYQYVPQYCCFSLGSTKLLKSTIGQGLCGNSISYLGFSLLGKYRDCKGFGMRKMWDWSDDTKRRKEAVIGHG